MLPYTSSVHRHTLPITSNTNQDRSLPSQLLTNVCHPKKAKILHKNYSTYMQETSDKKCKSGSMPGFFWAAVASCTWYGWGLLQKSYLCVFLNFKRMRVLSPSNAMHAAFTLLTWMNYTLKCTGTTLASQCPFAINSNKMQEDSLLKRLGWTKGVYIHEC